MNVLKCWPPDNRNPKPEEIKNCRPIFDLQLEIINPRFVVCLGKYAAENFLGEIQALGPLRGKVYETGSRYWFLVWYHPSYLLRNPKAKKDTWDDIQLLLKLRDQVNGGTIS